MNSTRRNSLIVILSFFTAGLVHGFLPSLDIWLRATLTGFSAAVIACALNILLPLPKRDRVD